MLVLYVDKGSVANAPPRDDDPLSVRDGCGGQGQDILMCDISTWAFGAVHLGGTGPGKGLALTRASRESQGKHNR